MCVGLVLTNAAGRVTWANRAAQATLGFQLAEAAGRPLGTLLKDPTIAEFWHRASEGGEVVLGQLTLHWPSPRQLKANASRCLDARGECIGRALLFCDVTQERHLQVQLSEETARRLLHLAEQQPGTPAAAPHTGLTPQELRILRLVGRGLGNKEIAREIHVAETTVRSHLKHVYGKLGLASRSEAIRYALQHGLQ